MRFRYASYEVDPSATTPDGVLYRPEVVVDVIGPKGFATIQALADTGSDETILPASVAQAMGARLDRAAVSEASAVGGHVVQLVPGTVTLRLSQGDEAYQWSATVGFLEVSQPEDEVALLGYAGFLEFFRATFDSQNYELDLTPHHRFIPS
jgi:hypothetical protein